MKDFEATGEVSKENNQHFKTCTFFTFSIFTVFAFLEPDAWTQTDPIPGSEMKIVN
jgi:hypothetical protein